MGLLEGQNQEYVIAIIKCDGIYGKVRGLSDFYKT